MENFMKKGDYFEGVIERVDYPNRGRVRAEDQWILVKNGMPGQKIRGQINKKRSGRLEGRLLEVLEKSPLETRDAGCSIFPDCGGCLYRTMSYESQLEMKEEQIRRLLKEAVLSFTEKNGSTDSGQEKNEFPEEPFAETSQSEPFIFEGILPSPLQDGYRNKMEFSFGDAVKDGPLTLGLHKKGSTYDILTAADCRLVHSDMNHILSCVLHYFTELGAPYYRKMQHTGYLRHLLLRRGTRSGEILVCLVTTSQADYPLQPLTDRLLSLPLEGTIVGVLHVLNDSLSDTVQGDEIRVLAGRDHFYEELLGLSFKISPFSFFQPNSMAAEVLYSKVREYIGDTKGQVVFDLYSGTGTIAQLAASVAKEVIGVEIVEEAVKAARENAARNKIGNCRFIAGDVLKVLDELTEKPDLIILDPPRDGVHPKALTRIVGYGVERIVYISCKATSLARDLPEFYRAGYRIQKACCVDQFVNTPHVETVCLLSNTQRPKKESYITLDVEMEDYHRIKSGRGEV